MRTLDDAIKRFEQLGDQYDQEYTYHPDERELMLLGREYWQLARWLRELKEFRDKEGD